jgi:hypothetical protein
LEHGPTTDHHEARQRIQETRREVEGPPQVLTTDGSTMIQDGAGYRKAGPRDHLIERDTTGRISEIRRGNRRVKVLRDERGRFAGLQETE